MSKLIYSQTSTLLEGTYDGIKNRDLAVNPVYYAIAFTGDGFLYTHGRKFRLFNIVNDVMEGISFSVVNGTAGLYIDGASFGTGTVVQSVTGDGIVTATTTTGAVSVGHAEFLTDLQATTYGSATQIPIITISKSGHITAVQNSNTIDISKIRADSTTTTGQYHPVGVTDSNLQNPVYHTGYYFDGSGNVYANNFYINNSPLSNIFAPIAHVSVYADDSTYGHVKLSDTVDSTKDVNEHIAATPKAVSAGVSAANLYSQLLFAAQDAMVFIGTLQADGTITSHNSAVVPAVIDDTSVIGDLDYKVGWTFRFVNVGTFNGQDVEVGDMIIAVKAKSSNFDITDWTIIQTNISGALTATSNLSGLLYANNSRVINALALSNGILKYDGTNLAFVNPNTIWRSIEVNSVSIGANTLNLLPGNAINISDNNGDVTIAVNASTIIGTSANLYLEQGNVRFTYNPSSLSTLTVGSALSLTVDLESNYTINHAAGTTFTNRLGYITTDSCGHITGVTDVTTLPNPNNLVFKTNNDTSFFTYSGSSAQTLVFANGTDISFASSTNINEETVLTPTITHRYRPVQFYANTDSISATSVLANNVSTALTLIGGANVHLTNLDSLGQDLPDGTIVIHADDTWRNIQAYKFQSNTLAQSSIGDSVMKFGNDFLWSNEELGIMWTEIDDNGNVAYVK